MILWDIDAGTRVRTFEGHDRGLACIDFKGDLIVSGSNDEKIKLWSASTGECLQTLEGHTNLVRALSFDPVLERLVSASYDQTVIVWELKNSREDGVPRAKLLREFKGNHHSHVFDVKFNATKIIRYVTYLFIILGPSPGADYPLQFIPRSEDRCIGLRRGPGHLVVRVTVPLAQDGMD